jgi:acyl carrier protein
VSEEVIRRFITQEVAKDGLGDVISDDFPLLDRQVLDSLGMFQLVSFLEDEFDIEIDDEELVPSNFNTVRDISRLVHIKAIEREQ